MSSALLISEEVESRFGAALDRIAPGRDRVVLTESGAVGDPKAIEVAYFSGDVFPERARHFARTLRESEHLRWLHAFGAGVDDPWFQRMLERGVVVTTSSGASAVPIAHSVLGFILSLSRDSPAWMRDQDQRRWNPRPVADLQGKTLIVVGLGPIGLEVARLGGEFGMTVVGLRRTPKGDEPCRVATLERLGEFLPQADFLVLALPLAAETRHILDAAALARMKSDAFVINVGRGALVDEAALIQALESHAIAGAALDVFETEPLPEDSPLWSLPRVIITPHSLGQSPGNYDRATEIFLENLGCYLAGQPLRNQARVEAPRSEDR